MKALSEVVKVFDVETIQTGDGEAFRFRLEVMRELNTNSCKGRVYRLETYRLQPTFPQSEGCLPDWQNDALIYVVDDVFDSCMLSGDSVQEVVGKFQRLLNDLFNSPVL